LRRVMAYAMKKIALELFILSADDNACHRYFLACVCVSNTILCACDMGCERRVGRYRRTVLRSSITYYTTNLHTHHHASGTTKRHCALLDLPIQLHQCHVCLSDQCDAHVNAAVDRLTSRESFSLAIDLSPNRV
jgi:hypothetical protein